MLTAGLQTRPQAAALQRRPAPRMAPRRGPVPRPVCQAPPAAASAPAQTQELVGRPAACAAAARWRHPDMHQPLPAHL